MKRLNKMLLAIVLTLITSHVSLGQQVKNTKFTNDQIVDKLNTPVKIWISGTWDTYDDGAKYWKRGYWSFQQKSFQQKSEILRKKDKSRNKA